MFQLTGKHISFRRKRQETSADSCFKEYVKSNKMLPFLSECVALMLLSLTYFCWLASSQAWLSKALYKEMVTFQRDTQSYRTSLVTDRLCWPCCSAPHLGLSKKKKPHTFFWMTFNLLHIITHTGKAILPF